MYSRARWEKRLGSKYSVTKIQNGLEKCRDEEIAPLILLCSEYSDYKMKVLVFP